MIETSSLTMAMGTRPVLHNLTVSFPAGRFSALVGPNGAGKSTLLAGLGRLVAPQAGAVRLEGRLLGDFAPSELARRIAIMRQNWHVAPRLTVRDLIGFGRYPHSHGGLGARDHDKIEEAIERLDLGHIASDYLDTLSGGQKQRAQIAMVLAQDTDVILLDEPLNNLDILHARAVMRIAREEAAAGKTVIVVLHDLSVAAAHADHVVALREGRLHAQGPARDVLTSEGLSALYQTEVSVVEHGGRRIVLTA